jgi:hypothetical protein
MTLEELENRLMEHVEQIEQPRKAHWIFNSKEVSPENALQNEKAEAWNLYRFKSDTYMEIFTWIDLMSRQDFCTHLSSEIQNTTRILDKAPPAPLPHHNPTKYTAYLHMRAKKQVLEQVYKMLFNHKTRWA